MVTSLDELITLPGANSADGRTVLGSTLVIKGEIRSGEHLIIDGTVDGHVIVPKHGVAVGKSGSVGDEIVARTITVLGNATGKLIGTERVELLESSRTNGLIVTAAVTIADGAHFNGSVDPKLTDAALAVSDHRRKQRDDKAS